MAIGKMRAESERREVKVSIVAVDATAVADATTDAHAAADATEGDGSDEDTGRMFCHKCNG